MKPLDLNITEGISMAEFDDTDRLNWVLSHSPEFEEGFMRVWLGPSSAPDGLCGHYITRGDSERECIDKALMGKFKSID